MGTREELIRSPFTKAMRLIEVGPSYHPIVPRSEGWLTTIVDHADREELSTKYRKLASMQNRSSRLMSSGDIKDSRRLGLRRSQRRKLDVERRETARGATVIERVQHPLQLGRGFDKRQLEDSRRLGFEAIPAA
jgi:hypothetical protein